MINNLKKGSFVDLKLEKRFFLGKSLWELEGKYYLLKCLFSKKGDFFQKSFQKSQCPK